MYLNDKEIIMPVKEYELLLFLAENPNIVFNKEVLFDRIWGMDAMGDASTVTVHIQRIRDKIDKGGKNKFIETVWAPVIDSASEKTTHILKSGSDADKYSLKA